MAKASIKLGNANVSTLGKFRLDVNRDKKKFSITNINAFVPYGKTIEDKKLFTTESGDVESLIIDRHFILFDPENNPVHAKNVETFIQHPDVRIGSMSNEEHKKLVKLKIKKSNPKFTITNIDRVDDLNYDNESALLEARYKLRNTKEPLSLNRLIHIAAALKDISYRTDLTDKSKYRRELIKKIDKVISSSKEKRELFVEFVDKIKLTEFKYYINELETLGKITNIGGIYKVGDRPIGATEQHVINFYEQNNDVYLIHKEMVHEANTDSIIP